MAFKAVKLTLRERIEQERQRLEVAKETRPPIDFSPALNTIDIPRETPVQRRVIEPIFYDFKGTPQEPVPIVSITGLAFCLFGSITFLVGSAVVDFVVV